MKSWGLLVWLLISGWSCAAQPKPNDCHVPLWSADVVQDPTLRRTPARAKLIDSSRAGVKFLDNDRLVVYEVDLQTSQLSSRESPNMSSPFRLRASILDARSGKKQLSK